MDNARELVDRFYVCCTRLDGLYYMAARKLGVKDNALALLYLLYDGKPHSQKQIAEELLIPKTTINTIVKEYMDAGYLTLTPVHGSREKGLSLTQEGFEYASKTVKPVYQAEDDAMVETLKEYPPEFIEAVEALTRNLALAFQREVFEQGKES